MAYGPTGGLGLRGSTSPAPHWNGMDCVDHDILLSRLQSRFGLDSAVLAWIRSFLSDRTQRVCFSGRLSTEIAFIFGIPQGSVFGPLLFLLYTAELFDIIASLGLTGHSYADDKQVYISAPVVESQQAAVHLAECIERLDRWMVQNGLKLNTEKTQLMWFGSRHQLAKLTISQLPLSTTMGLVVTTTSRRFLLAYTGFQYASESSTRRRCLCGSVYTMQPLATWLTCVCRPTPWSPVSNSNSELI